MVGSRSAIVKRDLHAANTRYFANVAQHIRPGMRKDPTVRAKQSDAETIAPVGGSKLPTPLRIDAYDGFNPTRAAQIRPLIGKSQVNFYDSAPDGLKIHHARVALQMLFDPAAAVILELWMRTRLYYPIVKYSSAERQAVGVPEPERLTIDHGDVGAAMFAL